MKPQTPWLHPVQPNIKTGRWESLAIMVPATPTSQRMVSGTSGQPNLEQGRRSVTNPRDVVIAFCDDCRIAQPVLREDLDAFNVRHNHDEEEDTDE